MARFTQRAAADPARAAVHQPLGHRVLRVLPLPVLRDPLLQLHPFTGIGNPVFTGAGQLPALLHDPRSVPRSSTPSITRSSRCRSRPAALGLALLLNMNVRGQAFYRTLFYIPSIVPVVASSLIFVWIFQPSFGIVNSLLSDVHVNGPAWFFSITWSKPTFILLGLWGLGQPMVIYLAALQGVPKEMYEVAALREPAAPAAAQGDHPDDQPGHPVQRDLVAGAVHPVLRPGPGDREPAGEPGQLDDVLRHLLLPAGVPGPASRTPRRWRSCSSSWSIITVVLLKTSSRWVYYENDQR